LKPTIHQIKEGDQMQNKKLPYLLGVIKWINTFTFLMWISTLLTRVRMFDDSINIYISLAMSFILTQIIFTFGIGRLLEKKFGRENLIDNNKTFKIISMSTMVSIAFYVILIRKEAKMFLFIIGFVVIFSIVMGVISKARLRSKVQTKKGGF
jgi:hypothetical protein